MIKENIVEIARDPNKRVRTIAIIFLIIAIVFLAIGPERVIRGVVDSIGAIFYTDAGAAIPQESPGMMDTVRGVKLMFQVAKEL